MPRHKKKSPRKLLLSIAAALAALILVLTILEITGATNFFKSKPPAAVPTTALDASTPGQDKSQAATDTSPDNSKHTDNNAATDASNLKAPSGTLVSNHSPSLSNNSVEVSVCSTSIGATCEIKLTLGNLTKSLPIQSTDNEGNVTWRWDVKTAGLSVGKWQLTAIAKLGNNTLTTTDSLDVQP